MPPETLTTAFEEICQMDGPLSVRLEAYAAKLRELNYPFAEAYDKLIERFRTGGVGTAAPEVGETMPAFLLPSKSCHLISLDDLVRKGPVVISLNRGHWCPFCKIELRTLAGYHDEIAKAGAQIVSIMPDRQEFVGHIDPQTLVAMQILTDIDNGFALSLGLVVWVGEELKVLMRGRGYHLDTFHGNDSWFVPVPATFVVGSDKRVIARFVDPDFRRRMEIGDILKALKHAS